MPTIQPRADLSSDDLLHAVDQLESGELDDFASRVLAIRTGRKSPCLSPAEASLLHRINQGLPPDQHDHYRELIAKRQTQTLTPAEHRELLQLTDQAELLEADRAAALTDLAQLRQTSIDDLLRRLGLLSPSDG